MKHNIINIRGAIITAIVIVAVSASAALADPQREYMYHELNASKLQEAEARARYLAAKKHYDLAQSETEAASKALKAYDKSMLATNRVIYSRMNTNGQIVYTAFHASTAGIGETGARLR